MTSSGETRSPSAQNAANLVLISTKEGVSVLQVGDRFSWETLGGMKYSGVIVEIDNGTFFVMCGDGVRRCC
jgi:hypothetical protein